MPRKSEKVKINNPTLDKRVKLSDEQKKDIYNAYQLGNVTQSYLAKKYNVSRRTISYIIDPGEYERMKLSYKERRKDGRYYDKDKHTVAVRMHRQYKDELYKKGMINNESNV